MQSSTITGLRLLCFLSLAILSAGTGTADDWPQWRGPKRDGVWRETGVIEKFDARQIPILWRAEVHGGFSGPTVADGRVYVTDRIAEPEEKERVLCFDAGTGRPLWTYSYDCVYNISCPQGPRASVTVHDGRAYSLGAMGHLTCLDARDGSLLWQRDLNREYRIRMPHWGIAAAPLVEGGLVIVQIGGRGGACLVAFNAKTGAEKWRALDDHCSYSAPIVIDHAGKRVLVCWTGDSVTGLNPLTGEVYWRYPFTSPRWSDPVATPAMDRGRLFFTGFIQGSLMLRLVPDRPAVEKVWARRGVNEKNTDALHSLIPTPILDGDYVYGIDSYGELRCLDARTGDRIWENLDIVPNVRWGTAHLVRNGDKVWMFNETGELIISRFLPRGLEVISRAKLIEPTGKQALRKKGVCWAHPAFAGRHVFARSHKELVCASLTAR